jgi:hypothetical protein
MLGGTPSSTSQVAEVVEPQPAGLLVCDVLDGRGLCVELPPVPLAGAVGPSREVGVSVGHHGPEQPGADE